MKQGWGAIAGIVWLVGGPSLAQTRLVGPSPPRPDAPRLQPPSAEETKRLTLPEAVQKQAAALVNQYPEGTAVPCTLTIERVLFDNRRVVTTSPWSCRLLKEESNDRPEVLTVLFPNLTRESRPSPTRLQPAWVTVTVGAKAGHQTALVRAPGTPLRQRFLLPFILEGEFGQAAN
ncbi:MAG TPA: hypothetical protein DCQ32_09680 [Cyanobacteria bacterium UBA8156]|nr:hypothetical protein [Cyanobacteria bacterium UBA8156]